MTYDDIMKRPSNEQLILLPNLCSRWKCVGCSTVIGLKVAAVIGHVCCPGCGMTLLRPDQYLLGPVKVEEVRI